MKQLTNQEAFAKVLAHIRAQGYEPAVVVHSPHKACRYRAPDGKKCAVGALLPDELYEEDFEDTPASEVHENLHRDPRYPLQNVDVQLLEDMQQAHDTLLPDIDLFERDMQRIASSFFLEYE